MQLFVDTRSDPGRPSEEARSASYQLSGAASMEDQWSPVGQVHGEPSCKRASHEGILQAMSQKSTKLVHASVKGKADVLSITSANPSRPL